VKKKSANSDDEKPAARSKKGGNRAKASSKRSSRTSKTRKKTRKKMSKAEAKRAARLTRAFVASSDLKPMARQLLHDRSRAAYAGVEAYARRHPSSDAGSLAWLADGYARILDKDQVRAIDSLKRAQTHAGDLGDYVTYYLAASYAAVGRSSDATSELRDFEKKYPDSVLLRDAMRIYGLGFWRRGRPQRLCTSWNGISIRRVRTMN
jgi:soluble lytic murein transglycosylase